MCSSYDIIPILLYFASNSIAFWFTAHQILLAGCSRYESKIKNKKSTSVLRGSEHRIWLAPPPQNNKKHLNDRANHECFRSSKKKNKKKKSIKKRWVTYPPWLFKRTRSKILKAVHWQFTEFISDLLVNRSDKSFDARLVHSQLYHRSGHHPCPHKRYSAWIHYTGNTD